MGNCLGCLEVDSDEEQYHHSGYGGGYHSGYGGGAEGGGYRPLPNEEVVTTCTFGYKAVAHDLAEFECLNKLPAELGYYVLAFKDTQKNWYAKLLRAWKRANPPPTSDEAVVVLIIETLQGHDDIQGLLRFYRLPCPTAPTIRQVPEITKYKQEDSKDDHRPIWPRVFTLQEDHRPMWPRVYTRQDVSKVTQFEEEDEEYDDGLAWPPGVGYEIHTLPVNEETIGDGDGFTVFVDVYKDARETANLPLEIKDAVKQRRIARNQRNFSIADALQIQIENENYKVCNGKKGRAPSLLRKYKIRLRGVDAPEIGQIYGEEAKVVLRKLIKNQELMIHVYDTDCFGREVGDVYCNGVFIQEVLLKEGTVWHFRKYDRRKAFAKWQREAKAARRGLWRDASPEAPWIYRKRNPEMFYNNLDP